MRSDRGRRLRVALITPAAPGSRHGNRTTAVRWAAHLRALGHRVSVAERWGGEDADVLVALHARKSAAAVARFHAAHPDRPIVLCLTGTDVYPDLRRSAAARAAVARATRLVVLQPLALDQLAPPDRAKARVILQSVPPPARRRTPSSRSFDVCILAGLRAVKDPFRTALAVRGLPAASRIRVLHAGGERAAGMAARARAAERASPRYRWLGELPRPRALDLLRRARLLVLSSRLEGGANVVSEAIVQGTPVLASHVPGNVGLLGSDYPGYFAFGDTRGLRDLLLRAEADPRFLATLARRCRALAPRFHPRRERAAWRALLRELAG